MGDPRVVLVVEDDQPLVTVIASHLEREGYQVLEAGDGPGAVQAVAQQRPDVVLLDIGLPGFDGHEVLRQVREFSDTYVIMLTARDDDDDKARAFSAGADDYVVKPFAAKELIWRIAAVLRRPRSAHFTGQEPMQVHDLRVDLAARTVRHGRESVDLTRTEFDLLVALIQRRGDAATRRQLLDEVWGVDWIGDEQVVDVHVAHLRSKLGDPATHPNYIRTVRGVGYAIIDEIAR